MAKGNTATAPREKGGLSGNKLKVLQQLTKATNGLTRKELSTKTGIKKGFSKMLGAATKSDSENTGMEGDGLVKSQNVEGRRGLVYTITAAGRKALEKASK